MSERESTELTGATLPGGRGDWARFLLTWLALPSALVIALLLGALMMLAPGANLITGYRALLEGAFGGSYALSSTAIQAVPLLLVGVGICIAFRANVFNIGGEGQIAMGGLLSAATALALPDLPGFILMPLVLLAGALGGAIWGAIPGFFKAQYNVNEILSTIMLNLVAVQVMNFMLAGPLVDQSPSSVGGLIPETKVLPDSAQLPILVTGTQLHLGVPIAVLVAIGVYVLLWRTSFGFQIRSVGLSRRASAYAGMPVKRTITLAMTLSGAMCGLAGAILVFGSISHRMVTDGSLTGFTGSAGFNGIVVALFGGLIVGGSALQVATGVPSDLVTALSGTIVVLVVSLEYLRRRARAQSMALASPRASSAPPLLRNAPPQATSDDGHP